jgi:hypothetical protein
MSWVRAFFGFWYDFIVGDDWRIAAGVVGVLALGALGVATGLGSPALAVALLGGLIAIFALPILLDGRS